MGWKEIEVKVVKQNESKCRGMQGWECKVSEFKEECARNGLEGRNGECFMEKGTRNEKGREETVIIFPNVMNPA